MSERTITFDEIQVGDRIRVTNREEYTNGDIDTDTAEFTVIGKTTTLAEGVYRGVYNVSTMGSTITLLDRPEPKPKVGDNLTPAQIMALPDDAVFLGVGDEPRVVCGGRSYGASMDKPLAAHNYRLGYRLVYLPPSEQEN